MLWCWQRGSKTGEGHELILRDEHHFEYEVAVWVDIDWVVGNEVVVISLKLINGTSLLMVANLLGVTAGWCSFCHERSQLADKDKIVWPFFNRKGDRTSQTVSLLVLVLWTLQPAFCWCRVLCFCGCDVQKWPIQSIHPPSHPSRDTSYHYRSAVYGSSYHQR